MQAGLDPGRLAVVAVVMALFGAVVGVAFRRVARLLAIVLVLQFMTYRYLESKGIVRLQMGGSSAGAGTAALAGTEGLTVASLVSAGLLGGSFVLGFALGVRKA